MTTEYRRESHRRPPHCSLLRIEIHRLGEILQTQQRAGLVQCFGAECSGESLRRRCSIFLTASQLQSLLVQPLIDFGEAFDQIQIAPVLVHLTDCVFQCKFRNAAISCLALDFACQLPSTVQNATWGGA